MAVRHEEDWFIARCLGVDVASQGSSIAEALSNLVEAVELCRDETQEPAESNPLVTAFQVRAA